jgi:hypothetical protein
MSEPDGVFVLSSDHEIHAAALAAHTKRQSAKDRDNRDYWLRHIKAARQTKEEELLQSLNIGSTLGGVKTISTDDPKITLPSGKRTDELNTQQLRAEMLALKIPDVSQTSGRQELLGQLKEYVTSITVVNWPTNPGEPKC